MRETIMDTVQRNGHEWKITRRTWELGAAPYIIYRDDEYWSTAESYREAMEEVKDEANQ